MHAEALSWVPGTTDHKLEQAKREVGVATSTAGLPQEPVDSQRLDPHTIDGRLFDTALLIGGQSGPLYIQWLCRLHPMIDAGTMRQPHFLPADVEFVKGSGTGMPHAPHPQPPRDMIHTAKDEEYVHPDRVAATVTHPPPEGPRDMVHTAQDEEYVHPKRVGATVTHPPPQGPRDMVHTVEDEEYVHPDRVGATVTHPPPEGPRDMVHTAEDEEFVHPGRVGASVTQPQDADQ
jgi:hypothetical protein